MLTHTTPFGGALNAKKREKHCMCKSPWLLACIFKSSPFLYTYIHPWAIALTVYRLNNSAADNSATASALGSVGIVASFLRPSWKTHAAAVSVYHCFVHEECVLPILAATISTGLCLC